MKIRDALIIPKKAIVKLKYYKGKTPDSDFYFIVTNDYRVSSQEKIGSITLNFLKHEQMVIDSIGNVAILKELLDAVAIRISALEGDNLA